MNGERLTECPECGGGLFFTPDGRTQQCERCGYRHELKLLRKNSITELDKALRFMGVGRQSAVGASSTDPETSSRRRIYRDMLAQGISAAKQKNVQEAYYYLSRILKAANSHETERLSAWMWLSAVAETNEEKRICLENVLVINPSHPGARRGLALLEGRLKQEDIIDPEELPETDGDASEVRQARAEQMACPRCGGRMNYKPEVQVVQCDFCHYQVSPDGGEEAAQQDALNDEQDFIVALATTKGHRQPIQMRTIQCKSCGVEYILAPETLSLTCPYCESVYVVEAAETQEIVPPQGVIPFTVSQEEAEKALRDWFRAHRIERPRLSPIIGAYVPVWTFDISGPLKWSCMVKEGDNWVRRTGEDFTLFDDFLVPASESLPETLTDHFDEFDMNSLVSYDARYLADFPAERYQTTVANASIQARGKIMKALRKRPQRYVKTANYRDFKLSASGGLAVQSYKLILLPLWITHYKMDDELYDVTINGQNKAIHGARPKGVVGRLVSWLLG